MFIGCYDYSAEGTHALFPLSPGYEEDEDCSPCQAGDCRDVGGSETQVHWQCFQQQLLCHSSGACSAPTIAAASIPFLLGVGFLDHFWGSGGACTLHIYVLQVALLEGMK